MFISITTLFGPLDITFNKPPRFYRLIIINYHQGYQKFSIYQKENALSKHQKLCLQSAITKMNHYALKIHFLFSSKTL
jgi:hypothetical protein